MLAASLPAKQLAPLCRRLGTAVDAGIDLRRACEQEKERAGSARAAMTTVSQALNRGETFESALQSAGPSFPPLMRAVATVGEKAGRLEEALHQLADHYDERVAWQQTFRSMITWPIVQLLVALAVVAILIAVSGIATVRAGETIDILGLGLVGSRGVMIYLSGLFVVALAILALWAATARSESLRRLLHAIVLRIPWVGGVVNRLSVERYVWALSLTSATGMDVMRAVDLAIDAADDPRYESARGGMMDVLRGGDPICEAMTRTGLFDRELLAGVAVGEQAGRLPESLRLMAVQIRQQSRAAMAMLVQWAGYAIWAAVACLIIALIFRMFSFYLGVLNDALEI